VDKDSVMAAGLVLWLVKWFFLRLGPWEHNKVLKYAGVN